MQSKLGKIKYKNVGTEIEEITEVTGIESTGHGGTAASCKYATEKEGTYTGNSLVKSLSGGELKIEASINWKVNGKFLKYGEEIPPVADKVVKHFEINLLIFKYLWLKEEIVATRVTLDGGQPGMLSLTQFEFLSNPEVVGEAGCAGTATMTGLPYSGELKKRGGKYFVLLTGVHFKAVNAGGGYAVAGTYEATGSIEGEWDNATTELIFPATPLEGSTLELEGHAVTIIGNDLFVPKSGETLEIAEE